MTSLRQFQATRFEQPMERGVNAPFLVQAEELSSGQRELLVVKCRAGYQHDSRLSVRELLALLLARCWGFTTVEPVVVDLPVGLEFGASDYSDPNGRDFPELIRQSHGLNFATIHLGTDWKPWLNTEPPQSIPEETLRASWAFDALVQNTDRREDNPNLLWRGDELALLDFDKAFGYLLEQTPKPWRQVLPLLGLKQHCLATLWSLKEGERVSDTLWDAFETWVIEEEGVGLQNLQILMEDGLQTSLDFSDFLNYFNQLQIAIDDFFEHLSAHARLTS